MSEQRCWELAASALSGRATVHDFTPDERKAFVAWASENRLAGLLASGGGPFGSGAIHDSLLAAASRQVAYSVYQEEELRRFVSECRRAGISPIFFKGTALGYTLYPDAALRPGVDHDLLVPAEEAPRLRAVLERLGHAPDVQVTGDLVTSQFTYRRIGDRGIPHVFDVHLKIVNALAYANRLSYDEVRSEAISMPRLDPHALAPSTSHSLLIACVHRVAHHGESDDLLWLFDIHLLARSLSPAEWDRLLALTEAKRLSAVALRGLESAQRAFGPSAADAVRARLRDQAAREPPAPLLDAGTRTIDVVLTDFASLPSWRLRLRLLAEHLFPPVSYMRQIHPSWPSVLLPFAYAYRIVRGAPNWFRPGTRK